MPKCIPIEIIDVFHNTILILFEMFTNFNFVIMLLFKFSIDNIIFLSFYIFGYKSSLKVKKVVYSHYPTSIFSPNRAWNIWILLFEKNYYIMVNTRKSHITMSQKRCYIVHLFPGHKYLFVWQLIAPLEKF